MTATPRRATHASARAKHRARWPAPIPGPTSVRTASTGSRPIIGTVPGGRARQQPRSHSLKPWGRRCDSGLVIRYCRRCIMPETKPDIFFDDEGICSACRHFAERAEVDWDHRQLELEAIIDRYRASGNQYDCIVPVSGGKDSTFQTLRVLQLGLRPLCVTSTT